MRGYYLCFLGTAGLVRWLLVDILPRKSTIGNAMSLVSVGLSYERLWAQMLPVELSIY